MFSKTPAWMLSGIVAVLVLIAGGIVWGMASGQSDVHIIDVEPIVISFDHGYYPGVENSSVYSYEVRNYPCDRVADIFNLMEKCEAESHAHRYDGTGYVSVNKILFKKLTIYPQGRSPEIEYLDNEKHNQDAQKYVRLLIQALYF